MGLAAIGPAADGNIVVEEFGLLLEESHFDGQAWNAAEAGTIVLVENGVEAVEEDGVDLVRHEFFLAIWTVSPTRRRSFLAAEPSRMAISRRPRCCLMRGTTGVARGNVGL